MDKILSSINTRLNYINSNTDNAFILKETGIIDTKLDDIRNRTITTQQLLDYVCDKIVNYDIKLMKGVSGQTNMVYKKMDELAELVTSIKDAYFEE